MPAENGIDGPVANYRIHGSREVMSKSFSSAKGEIVNGIGGKDMLRIPVTLRIIAVGIEDVLPIAVGILRLTAPASVVARAIRHTFLVSVGNLGLQAVAGPFLQHRLQGVVVHVAHGGAVFNQAKPVGTIGWRSRGNPID